jgi:hypothetical protein
MKYIQPDWPAPSQIHAYTTVREAWGDDPKNPLERQKLRTLLQMPDDPIWINQTHSNIVLEAKPRTTEQIADATFTTHPKRICAILTADCLPILVCNTLGNQVAAIHAGWRGLANGIIENTLKSLKGSSDLLVWLGPAISQSKFEVGSDVYDAFTLRDSECAAAFIYLQPGKWLADLYALARIKLTRCNVSQIYGGQFCTFTQSDLFFSYRRDKNELGRMAHLIWIAS